MASIGAGAAAGPAGPARAINENPFDDVLEQVDRAAQVLGLQPAEVELLKHPKRQVIALLPAQMDNGTVQIFTGLPRAPRQHPRPRARAASATTPRSTSMRSRRSPPGCPGSAPGRRRVRRGQGRRDLRPDDVLAGRAGTADAPLYRRDLHVDRANLDIPPRCGHQRPGDGLDDGYLLDEEGVRRACCSPGKPIVLGGSLGREEERISRAAASS